jgi:hypothetical protein
MLNAAHLLGGLVPQGFRETASWPQATIATVQLLQEVEPATVGQAQSPPASSSLARMGVLTAYVDSVGDRP